MSLRERIQRHHWEAAGHCRQPGIYAVAAAVGRFETWLYVGMSAHSIADRITTHRGSDSIIGPALNCFGSDGWDVLIYELPVPQRSNESHEDFRKRVLRLEARAIWRLDPMLNTHAADGRANREIIIRMLSIPSVERRRSRHYRTASELATWCAIPECTIWRLLGDGAISPPREFNGTHWWLPKHVAEIRSAMRRGLHL